MNNISKPIIRNNNQSQSNPKEIKVIRDIHCECGCQTFFSVHLWSLIENPNTDKDEYRATHRSMCTKCKALLPEYP